MLLRKRFQYYQISKKIIPLLLLRMAVENASASVEKAFVNNAISPSIVTAPKRVLNVDYASGVSVVLGEELKPLQVLEKPNVTWEADRSAFYTLMMFDPDAPSRRIHLLREVRHWLVVNIPGTDIESGEEIVEYRGVGAPRLTGLHRYIFLVYKQPNGRIQFDEPHIDKDSVLSRVMTSASKFSSKYKLSGPEFGNFFQAQHE